MPPRRPPRAAAGNDASDPVAGVRIIGGTLRGRKLEFAGDRRTRPMKDRLREALFSHLGRRVAGTHCLDLFAGTGALGIEAVSRGAARATLVEQHFPTAERIRQTVLAWGLGEIVEVVPGSAFAWQRWLRPEEPPRPWLVFCSPPYDFFVDRAAEMQELVAGLIAAAPSQSTFVVEADSRVDFAVFPAASGCRWDVRTLPPAQVGVLVTSGRAGSDR